VVGKPLTRVTRGRSVVRAHHGNARLVDVQREENGVRMNHEVPVTLGVRKGFRGCSVDLRACTRCGLPETYETIEFDAHGVCNICNSHSTRRSKIDWASKEAEFVSLLDEHRGRHAYDAIVPFSGGKDSTFTLYHLVTKYKLKPLVVQFDHGFMRPKLRENNERTFRRLGVEVHTFRPNWKLVRRVMLESLIRRGDFCWHCHTGIFAYPMWVALKEQVPLVIWGEPSTEYTAYFGEGEESVDEERFNRFTNLGITAEDMATMIESDFDLDERDMKPFTYPPRNLLRDLECRSVCLGSYIPWDTTSQSQLIQRELGWETDHVEGMPPDLYGFEKIECWMQGVRDYVKFLKRGYSRVSQMAALDVRNGRMTSSDAYALVAAHDGRKPPSLPIFLEYVGLTEEEFNSIVAMNVVSPHEPDFGSIAFAEPMPDMDAWIRDSSPL